MFKSDHHMMHIYASCDVWELGTTTRWRFSVDEGKKGKVIRLELRSTLEEL